MGALGLDLKSQVEALIDDPNLKSTSVVDSITLTEGSFGGYSTGTSVSSGTALVNCIPSNYIQSRTGLQLSGDLEEGELRVLVKAGTAIDTNNDVVTFQTEQFNVREIKPIFFNEEIIAKAIIMSKKFENDEVVTPSTFPLILG